MVGVPEVAILMVVMDVRRCGIGQLMAYKQALIPAVGRKHVLQSIYVHLGVGLRYTICQQNGGVMQACDMQTRVPQIKTNRDRAVVLLGPSTTPKVAIVPMARTHFARLPSLVGRLHDFQASSNSICMKPLCCNMKYLVKSRTREAQWLEPLPANCNVDCLRGTAPSPASPCTA